MKPIQTKRQERMRRFASFEEQKTQAWLEKIAMRKRREKAEMRLRELDEIKEKARLEASGIWKDRI